MRLGAWPAMLDEGSQVAELYGTTVVSERHRHRYEFNARYREQFEAAGLRCSGNSPDGRLGRVRRAAGALVLRRYPGPPGVQVTSRSPPPPLPRADQGGRRSAPRVASRTSSIPRRSTAPCERLLPTLKEPTSSFAHTSSTSSGARSATARTTFRRDVAVAPGGGGDTSPLTQREKSDSSVSTARPSIEFLLEIPAGTRDVPDEEPLEPRNANSSKSSAFRGEGVDAARALHELSGLDESGNDRLRGARSYPWASERPPDPKSAVRPIRLALARKRSARRSRAPRRARLDDGHRAAPGLRDVL